MQKAALFAMLKIDVSPLSLVITAFCRLII